MRTSHRWILRRRPVGAVGRGDLEFVEEAINTPGHDEVLVRTIYLSLDPTNRIWMSERDQYMAPVQLGTTMRGITIGVVEESRAATLKPGDIVSGLAGWTSHSVGPASSFRKVATITGLPLTAHLSVLGGNGLTAWIGLDLIGGPWPGQTVVVTAAAGAVGSVASQIAKLRGARVIGIAGNEEKCAWLTNDLGLHGAINYRHGNLVEELARHCPDGIDVAFENVGGTVMDAVIAQMSNFGRIALCGLISGYDDDGCMRGPRDFAPVLMHRLTIRGFITSDHMDRIPAAMAELVPWVLANDIKWRVHVEHGLETAPEALNRLFSGEHDGKLILQVSPEP